MSRYITHEPHDHDAWVCTCGNRPSENGFYPCDIEGHEVEPDEKWTSNCYVCNQCKRVIDQDSLEVVWMEGMK
jgi:hypothetical protein